MSLAFGDLPSEFASKMAGRLSNIVTTAYDKIGRAQLKAIYAQINAPISPMTVNLRQALGWWLKYLLMAPEKVWLPSSLSTPRPTIWVWTDAAGKSKKVAAVMYSESALLPGWSYTETCLPSAMWDSLICRRDNQIQYQEFVAIPLALESFGLSRALIFVFVDNNSVLSACVKGSGTKP